MDDKISGAYYSDMLRICNLHLHIVLIRDRNILCDKVG